MKMNERFKDDALHLPGHLTADAMCLTIYSPAESNSVHFTSNDITYNQKTLSQTFSHGKHCLLKKKKKNCIQVLQ